MKKYTVYALLFLCTPFTLHAKVGCMSKSLSLTEMGDPKQYHYVHCNCPCGSSSRYEILSRRGLCRECGHFHELKRIQILTALKQGLLPIKKQPRSNNLFIRYFQERNSLLF